MRKVFVGSVGLVASISMYSSPMVAAVSIKYYYVALTVVQQLMIKPHPELIMSDGFVSQSMDLNHYQLRLQTDTVSSHFYCVGCPAPSEHLSAAACCC
jgi:hypothetical protein